MKIYVASSWRNERQPQVVQLLRQLGHDVYDFKNPEDNAPGFQWSDIDSAWQQWSVAQYIDGMDHDYAHFGFKRDMDQLVACDLCILVLPCGRSAHLELGYAVGAGKKTAILMADGLEPELMYKMCARVCADEADLINYVQGITKERGDVAWQQIQTPVNTTL